MFSKLIKSFLESATVRSSLKGIQGYRTLYENSSHHENMKKFRLIKRLASTILFGGTFIAVLWARKFKKSAAFDDAKLVRNLNYQKNFKLYEYKNFVLPSFVMKNIKDIEKFKCREDDIFVVSFPKTGTTWVQEIIHCILKGTHESSETNIEDRFPYLEFIYPGLKSIENAHNQRMIKTHLPYSLLPEDIHLKKPKIFYVMRNPKDVAVSYYHFVRMITISDYVGSFEDFFEEFISDKIPYGPIWKHYEEVMEHKNEPNILILFYEDLHKDIHGSIKKIGNFLNKDLTENEIDDITEHCSFINMAKNPHVNYQHWDDLGIRKKSEARFMRKGVVGDWKNYFSTEMNEIMDAHIKEKLGDVAATFS